MVTTSQKYAASLIRLSIFPGHPWINPWTRLLWTCGWSTPLLLIISTVCLVTLVSTARLASTVAGLVGLSQTCHQRVAMMCPLPGKWKVVAQRSAQYQAQCQLASNGSMKHWRRSERKAEFNAYPEPA